MNENNPFQTPETMPVAKDPTIASEHAEKFKQQILALGAFWIIIGLLAVGIALAPTLNRDTLFSDFDQPMFAQIVVSVLGIGWMTIGVLAMCKNLVAVRVGLVLSYLSLIGQLFSLNLCAMVILGVVIAQAHRVLSWGKSTPGIN